MSLQIGSVKIGLREANQRFSEAIRIVKSGKEVVLTERGRPIAVIKPIQQARSAEQALKEMERDGVLQRAKIAGFPAFAPIKITGKPVSVTVMEDRD